MNQRQAKAMLLGEDERLLEPKHRPRADEVWAYFIMNWNPNYLELTERQAVRAMKADIRRAYQREHGLVRLDPVTLFIIGILVQIVVRWLFSRRPDHSETMLSWQAER